MAQSSHFRGSALALVVRLCWGQSNYVGVAAASNSNEYLLPAR